VRDHVVAVDGKGGDRMAVEEFGQVDFRLWRQFHVGSY
jgi:hypothetical protein